MSTPMSEERLTYWQQWADAWDGHNADGVRELLAEVRRLREEVSWHDSERAADDRRHEEIVAERDSLASKLIAAERIVLFGRNVLRRLERILAPNRRGHFSRGGHSEALGVVMEAEGVYDQAGFSCPDTGKGPYEDYDALAAKLATAVEALHLIATRRIVETDGDLDISNWAIKKAREALAAVERKEGTGE